MTFTDAERERARSVALAAAREAGAILTGFHGHLDRARIGTKSAARDLVTEADLASERCLVAHLRRAFPDHAIESEEAVRDVASSQPRWFLDPLDGTVNFVHGLPVFAVSMGLVVDGAVEVGVVHAPRLAETFHAVRGGGAYLHKPGLHKSGLHEPGLHRPGLGDERLAVSDCAELGAAILATGFPYRRADPSSNNVRNFVELILDVRDLRRMGAASLDLAFTAAGRFDGYWELQLAPHDVAAGALLVREAGGIVTDLDGREDWLRGGHVVASGPRLHAALRARLEH